MNWLLSPRSPPTESNQIFVLRGMGKLNKRSHLLYLPELQAVGSALSSPFPDSPTCVCPLHTTLPGSNSATQPSGPLHSPLESSRLGWCWQGSQLSPDILRGSQSSWALCPPGSVNYNQFLFLSVLTWFTFQFCLKCMKKPQGFPCLIPSLCLLLYCEHSLKNIYMLFFYSKYLL